MRPYFGNRTGGHKISAGRRNRFRRHAPIMYKDYKGVAYGKARARDMKRKWKNPKAGLRRKRYYTNMHK